MATENFPGLPPCELSFGGDARHQRGWIVGSGHRRARLPQNLGDGKARRIIRSSRCRTECLPYYFQYIDLVPDGHIVEPLDRQITETAAYLAAFTPEQASRREAPGEWNVLEIVGAAAWERRAPADWTLRSVRAIAYNIAATNDITWPTSAGNTAGSYRQNLAASIVRASASTIE